MKKTAGKNESIEHFQEMVRRQEGLKYILPVEAWIERRLEGLIALT